jgi:taurine dioxygenase
MATRAQERHIGRPEEVRDFKTIGVKPLTPVIGAEIEGVDLSQELSPAQLAEVRQAFLDHSVVVFRDQKISREDHKRFGRHFGRLHVHPYHVKSGEAGKTLGRDLGPDPEILIVKADANSKYVAGEEWHTDVSCDAEPPMGSMLYITQTPEIGSGGDTCFMSTYAA